MSLEQFSELEDVRLIWNRKAAEARSLSDDELIAQIQDFKSKLLDLKVTIEAAETELETRGRRVRDSQFKKDLSFDSSGAIEQVESRIKQQKKKAKSIDSALETLMSMGLTEDEARAKLASMK